MEEDVSGVEVGVEETVRNEHLKQHVDEQDDQFLLSCRLERSGGLAQAQPLHPAQRQHPPAAVARKHGWELDVDPPRKIGLESTDDVSLLQEIQLLQRVASKLRKEVAQVGALHPPRREPIGDAEAQPQGVQVAVHQARQVGPLHLYGDGRAVEKHRPMDLGQRGRGDRHRLERCE